jgi:hypothetical protein
MRLMTLVFLGVAAGALAGCVAGTPEVGEPPKRSSYEEWGARLDRIPEVASAVKLCKAALEHHRNANKTDQRDERIQEYNSAISLFFQSAEEYYAAWRKYPEYGDFVLWELDKLTFYINSCIAQKPYLIDPTDPLNIYGGPLTYEQRQRLEAYQQVLGKLGETSGP